MEEKENTKEDVNRLYRKVVSIAGAVANKLAEIVEKTDNEKSIIDIGKTVFAKILPDKLEDSGKKIPSEEELMKRIEGLHGKFSKSAKDAGADDSGDGKADESGTEDGAGEPNADSGRSEG